MRSGRAGLKQETFGRARPVFVVAGGVRCLWKRSAAEACTGVILRKLASAGVRPTRQRLDVARAIFGAGNRHFTAEMIYQETRAIRFAPTLGTIYNTLNEFARCGLLREIAIYDAKLWYDTKTGPHFHFYREDTEELSDIPEEWLPKFEIAAPDGTVIAAIDVIVRLKKV